MARAKCWNGWRRAAKKIDFCLVGEPTSREKLGDMIKIGRRGSLTGYLTVHGRQGHVAYPDRADNPLPKMLRLLAALDSLHLDEGSAHFQPSNLEIVTIDTGNTADNVIPAQCQATFNVRFNDLHTGADLSARIRAVLAACDVPTESYALNMRISGESFYTAPSQDIDLLCAAIEQVTGKAPELSTSGGTSDARFIRAHAPVVEFGIVGATIHQVDEHVALSDIAGLQEIYRYFLDRWYTA